MLTRQEGRHVPALLLASGTCQLLKGRQKRREASRQLLVPQPPYDNGTCHQALRAHARPPRGPLLAHALGGLKVVYGNRTVHAVEEAVVDEEVEYADLGARGAQVRFFARGEFVCDLIDHLLARRGEKGLAGGGDGEGVDPFL